jgi:hypothetical protein
MHAEESPVVLKKVTDFLKQIGIPIEFRSLDGFCFLPGIQVDGGILNIDIDQLKYPGDIVHEAGHIAVVPAAERATLNEIGIGERPMREAEEMMVIAWSYAVCVELNIDAGFVFHDQGYQTGGSHIAEQFKQGHYVGVPMLQWTGMALEKIDPVNPHRPVYPAMINWMRD